MIKKWNIKAHRTEFETPVFNVVSLQSRSPRNKKAYTFYRLECGDWVNILPITTDRQVVLVRQYRAGVDDFSLEIPGGLIDPGEDPLKAAMRELREETGFTTLPQHFLELGMVYPNPAIMNNRCFLFAAENVEMTGSQQLDQMEDIEVLIVPLNEFMKKILENEISHSLVLDTVLKYALQKGWILL